ncbi:MAG: AmmeMemoRadiSam system protein B [Candidatus Muiribacteriota bacterium]
MIRKTVVAGKFYENDKNALINQIKNCYANTEIGPGFFDPPLKEKARGAICPHAGYMFSGPVAAHAFNYFTPEKCGDNPLFIILSPNHTGMGDPVSLSNADYWETPLGNIKVYKNDKSSFFKNYTPSINSPHQFEHSIEVLLPFLQYNFKNHPFSILPVTLSTNKLAQLKKLSEYLCELNHDNIYFLISSDFSHYVSPESAKKKDSQAISFILENDINSLHDYCINEDVSVCGLYPIISWLYIAKKFQLKSKLLKYATSGDIMPMNEVVGYSSIIFW